MKCSTVRLPGGGTAIICRPPPRRRRCEECGTLTQAAQLRECDWEVTPTTTCDALICVNCTHSPAPGKDLCPTHAAQWRRVQRGGVIDAGPKR